MESFLVFYRIYDAHRRSGVCGSQIDTIRECHERERNPGISGEIEASKEFGI